MELNSKSCKFPSQYVLDHWTKEAARDVRNCENSASNLDDQHLTGALRSLHVSREAIKLVVLAEKSPKIYSFIMKELGQTFIKASSMEIEVSMSEEVPHLDSSFQTSADPHPLNTKGRTKDAEKDSQNKIFKSGLQVAYE
ncbi:uncharacterized protein [Rutidosis leptorrhynchoides]|uniref:uncharacterized protein n=1 Tax=Rutidosis leptorrhynchoides TaxID=125765 RepID=UPI003A9997A9